LYAARFSPDGSKVAVGFGDSTAVNVLSGTDLSFLYAPDTRGADNGNLMTVAWSQDGDLLYAAGRYHNSSGTLLLQWAQQGRSPATTLPAATNTIMDLHALKGGRLSFAACDPVFGVLASDGSKAFERTPDIVDYRDTQEKIRVSQDGAVVEFGFGTLTPQGTW